MDKCESKLHEIRIRLCRKEALKMNNAITVKNLTKKYENFKLNNISFQIPEGSIVGFVGENGAGKSTTIKAILGLIPIEAGEIELLGHKIKPGESETEYKEHIGVVFDECNFPVDLKIKYIRKIMQKVYYTWDDDKFESYLNKFKLSAEKKIKELSRGMKTKLSIAVALSHDSRLLILDEATSGLDPVIRDEILDIFREFIEDEEHTVFISSHITSDIEKAADYVMMIHKGEMLFQESKDELLYQYGIVRGTKKQIDMIPEEWIAGREENEFGCSALIKDKERLMNSTFMEEAEDCGEIRPVVDRAGIEDILLYIVKAKEM